MLTLRLAQDRGHFRNHWLNSYHSFSFGEYYDPHHMGIGDLRVINDDQIAAGAGFPTHPHNNMEIVTYVLVGALTHQDSMGTGSTIRAGDVQHMSAGMGVSHSEFNALNDAETHLLQIWLLPNQRNVKPQYAQQHFDADSKRGQWRLLVSPDGRAGSIQAHTDALMYASLLATEQRLTYTLAAKRQAYVHIARGAVKLNGQVLKAGDGAHLTTISHLEIMGLAAEHEAEVLLFDLAF